MPLKPFRMLRAARTLFARGDKKPEAHFVEDYERHVETLLRNHPLDEAMSLAVGGKYDRFGQVQAELLERLGLANGMTVLDLGCGSGRTAKYLGKRFPRIDYTGIDVVQKLLDYAQLQCPDHFRFVRHTDVTIPAADNSTDMVIAFSLFTHLHHEETFCYLEEAHRILRSGGQLVFSFLQFGRPQHWPPFAQAVAMRKQSMRHHRVTLIEENAIEVWAQHVGFAIGTIVRDNPLGQTVAALRKP